MLRRRRAGAAEVPAPSFLAGRGKVTEPVGVAPEAPVTVAVMVKEPVAGTETRWPEGYEAAARGRARRPAGHQVISVHRAEPAGSIVALSRRVAEGTGNTVRARAPQTTLTILSPAVMS